MRDIKKRLFYEGFDKAVSENRTAIMGLAMLSVMLFHQYFTSVIPFNIFHNFGYWGVDVFLFLSGMGLVLSLEKNSLKEYYKRRYRRIIPSCLICGTIKYLVFLFLGSSVAILKEGLKMGWWSLASFDLWFIPTIIILYVISPLLYRLLSKWPITVIIVISILMVINGLTLRPIIGYNWTSVEGVLSYTIERLLVFTLGMFVTIHKKSVDNNIHFSLLFLIIAIGITILTKSGTIIHGNTVYCLFALAYGIPALIIINILLLDILPIPLKKYLIFMGKYSLELYLVHEFIFWSMIINFVNVTPWILLLTGILLSCIVAYLGKLTVNKLLI